MAGAAVPRHPARGVARQQPPDHRGGGRTWWCTRSGSAPGAERVVGFVTAVSDGVLAAYLPLLEVLPEFQGQGIGSELVRRMLDLLGGLYMVDVVTDPDVVPFYERFGMVPGTALMLRRRDLLR
ncbi:GNAT family N-acetyltransferase [Nakamurella sp. YIM 132087]|uniref:GNAT family N-acetyltransferase n=1 Tax=Nakamurella alba TaxID=2665158 RepID=A0A7K1FJH8_9ACTN|nr:GNAT family N-acetyltransferase [Nakamurella alba]MTD14281.1 GNAT family N-acetyltransferase [Nakamurella alba]